MGRISRFKSFHYMIKYDKNDKLTVRGGNNMGYVLLAYLPLSKITKNFAFSFKKCENQKGETIAFIVIADLFLLFIDIFHNLI